MELDLSRLASVDAFAAAFRARFGGGSLHALVCNAGVPAGLRQHTAEGFSLDFGVSFIGHFELVRALLPALQATEGSRVVTVSSVMHWFGPSPNPYPNPNPNPSPSPSPSPSPNPSPSPSPE